MKTEVRKSATVSRMNATLRRLQDAASKRSFDLDAVADWLERKPVIDSERELTAAELDVLEAEGLSEPGVAVGPLISGLAEAVRASDESLSAGAAAKKLGISTSRVRQRLGEGRLFGIKQGRDWRLPRWQFRQRGTGTIPGIEAVLEVMPRDIHPLSAQGFMSTPQPELRVEGEAVSPLEWLGSGGDPQSVAVLAEEL